MTSSALTVTLLEEQVAEHPRIQKSEATTRNGLSNFETAAVVVVVVVSQHSR